MLSNLRVLFIVVFLLTGCATPAPRNYIVRTSSEQKVVTEKRESLFEVAKEKIDGTNYTIENHGIVHPQDKAPNGLFVQKFGINCTTTDFKKIRDVNYWSSGRKSYGDWESEKIESSKGSCLSEQLVRDKLTINSKHLEVVDLNFEEGADYALGTSSIRIPTAKTVQVMLKPKSNMYYIAGSSGLSTDALGYTTGMPEMSLNAMVDRLEIKFGEDKLEKEVPIQYIDYNSVADRAIKLIESRHFRRVHISTLNIDSHYPFHGAKITFDGNPPSKRSILGRYIKNSVLLEKAMERFNMDYVDGRSCCNQTQTVYVPSKYTVKVVHPSYHHTTKTIEVNPNTTQFDFLMSELGTKHRVKLVEY